MICSSCNTVNEAGRKFCGNCGARLAVSCPSCGSPNSPGTRFCGECGTLLTDGPTAAAADGTAAGDPAASDPAASNAATPRDQAERRLVSVLFADLVGFTTLSEARDAEAVRDLLSRYFERASAIVQEYGGTVEKFIGDAVMAVWGTPTAHEDDAERSVRAALDLVEAVRRLGQEMDADLQLRAGVLSGEAAVTVGATNQGMVAGDLVNTASRLQSAAAPGSVLVGEATYRAASGAISFEPAGDRDLKGKAAPVAAYRALRVVAKRGGIGRSDQLEAPFVGRTAELRLLKDFHAATGEERRPRLVSIMGQGGIGKSRLVWEFQKYLDGVTEVAYWHYGRSPAYGEGITFWALAEMVRGRAGIVEGEDPTQARAKLSSTLDEFVTDAAERQWIEPRLLQLLGLEETSGANRERETLFTAWRTFFERIAERGTVLLVFEDLQWADAGLLDFIDHVLDWSRDRPLYLITLARPELLERRPDWGAGRRNFTSLLLDPLDDDAMRELLRGLVPGLPDSVVDGILERAEGIPLYAVETVRMLLDEGRIERIGDSFQPVGDAQPLSIPATLQGLIAARLDGLDPADRSLLQAASVMGKTFSLDAAADVSGEDRDALTSRLRSLVRRELLTLEADPRSPERGQYGFVQGLIREVAYGGLGRRDRRRLHLAAARHFETLGDDGIAGVLAEHYVAAYHAQPDGPEGDAVAAQARVALRGAAERAASLGSHNQAATYFEQALEVTSNPDEQAQLHKAAGDAGRLGAGGTEEGMLAHYRAALELVSNGDDRIRQLEATTDLGRGMGWTGHSERAVALMEQALADFADLDGTAEWVRLNTELSRVYMLVGSTVKALARIEQVLPLAERLELRREVLELLVTRGATLANHRRLGEAIVLLIGAVSQARSLQLPGLELRAAVNLSYATAAEDALLSHRVAREGLELARHLGLGSQAAYLLNNASDTAVRIGEWDWYAEQLGDDSVADDSAPFGRLIHRARLRAFRGLESDALVAEAAAFLEGRTEIQAFSMLDDIRGDVAMVGGRFEEARRFAISSYERVDSPDSTARSNAGRFSIWLHDADSVARMLDEQRQVPGAMARISELELQAGLAALEGRTREAIGVFREVMARCRSAGVRFDLAIAGLTMVYALGTAHPEVREAAAEAREIFTQLGATPFLALLDAAEAAKPAAVVERPALEPRVSSTR